MFKNKLIKKIAKLLDLKDLVKRAITVIILTGVAIITVWVYAAFTEPLAGPNDSNQDFLQNILGANNANNDFISTSVVSNADGSLIERQEYLQTGIGTSTDAASLSTTLFAGQEYIGGRVDTTVSSRASATDYTSARATKIDNLDATVSSRLAAASYVTERGTDSAALAIDYTSARATKIDNLDATVSSRLAAASYVTERGTDSAALASNYTATRAGYLDSIPTISGYHTVPTADATANAQMRDVVGNKTDAAVTTVGTTKSLMAYVKGIFSPRGPVVAASAEGTSGQAYGHINAALYCYNLSAVAAYAMDGNTSTTYTDWRLPTVGEAAVFEGTIASTNYIWTATVRDATASNWLLLRLSDGSWDSSNYYTSHSVRCVR